MKKKKLLHGSQRLWLQWLTYGAGETVEAAIIVSVLLSFVEQLMLTGKLSSSTVTRSNAADTEVEQDGHEVRESHDTSSEYTETNPLLRRSSTGTSRRNAADGLDADERTRRLIARMKVQVWAGTGVGLLIATAIGAAFIAVVSFLQYRKLEHRSSS